MTASDPTRTLAEAVLTRSSSSKVTEQAPGSDEVERLLRLAATAPDHCGLAPWRVIEVRGDARERVGDALRRAALAAGTPDEKAAALATKPRRAPLLLAIVVSYRPSAKAERWEQEATAAGVAHLLTLLLDDAGWGVMWRSGPWTRTPEVAAAHRLGPQEALLGWLYVGGLPEGQRRPRRDRLDVRDHLSAL
ncbi:MAG TPA: nitroreductase family protein [Gryllotalpicola sp.]